MCNIWVPPTFHDAISLGVAERVRAKILKDKENKLEGER